MTLIRKNKWLILMSIGLYLLMYYATSRSPIVGDAYNYATVGLRDNPVWLAYLAYFSWSGRFFSELWGFFMCSKVELWNLLNPLFFVVIYWSIISIVNGKQKPSVMILTLIMMLQVEDHIRTQTYTWIMGTTYLIPLMLCLVYLAVLKHYVFDLEKKIPTGLSILMNFVMFYIGLTMENIAGAMLMILIMTGGYLYFTKKQVDKGLIINLLFSAIGLILLRSSPGANGRLAEYHPEWVVLSFFEKITHNVKYFVELTFTNNTVVLSLFIVLLLYHVYRFYQNKRKDALAILFSAVEVLALIFVLIPGLTSMVYRNGMHYLGWLYFGFWILFVIASIYLISVCIQRNKHYILLMVLVGGASSACLMISPIFSSRSMLYFVYFILLANLFLLDELELTSKQSQALLISACIAIVPVVYRYYDIYSEVARLQYERMEIVDYYRAHPEEKEAWIPRIPDNLIHSANIEDDNEYHMETFKKYYNLPEDLKIIFYNR